MNTESSDDMPATALNPLPPRPRLVLRLGFAGTQKLDASAETSLQTALTRVFQTLGHRLAAVLPGIPVQAGQEPWIARFYAQSFPKDAPLLRLVTGLCEGADAVAARALEHVNVLPDQGSPGDAPQCCLEKELAAILPFPIAAYRESRPETFRSEFDRQAAQCAYILELDGNYDKTSEPEEAKNLADTRRGRGYRAQSALLLRHSDILVAAADPSQPAKPGGTMETVRDALAFDLPVVFFHTGRKLLFLIEPTENLYSALSDSTRAIDPESNTLQDTLDKWVTQIVADPGTEHNLEAHGEVTQPDKELLHKELLSEFFADAVTPPFDPATRKRKPDWREHVWTRFEAFFRSGPGLTTDQPLAPYHVWRKRATELNYHYSGMYRGAFLFNYGAIIVAVALAALSLTLLAVCGENHPGWRTPTLLGLGIAKLCLVIGIVRNTYRANHEKWNDRAVDYRYLAERLRGMYYLPLAGSIQPPAASAQQYASRVIRQSHIDWLFDAIIHSVSPADVSPADVSAEVFPGGSTESRPGDGQPGDGQASRLTVKILRLNPQALVEAVRDRWICGQAIYHARSAHTMNSIHRSAEWISATLGAFVILFVAIDILIVAGEMLHRLHLLPQGLESWVISLVPWTPWLIFFAALLPAAVAALNGVRFQSECRRIAERSAVMRVILAGRAETPPSEKRSWLIRKWRSVKLVVWHLLKRPPAVALQGGRWGEADRLARRIAAARADSGTDPAAWSLDALHITETVATDFVHEVAGWSVLYAKELPEPG